MLTKSFIAIGLLCLGLLLPISMRKTRLDKLVFAPLGSAAPVSLVVPGWGIRDAMALGTCDKKIENAFLGFQAIASAYQSPILRFFHMELFMANKVHPAVVESALCHFITDMGMDPDLNNLPQTITKTFDNGANSVTVELDVTSPTATFATTAGYKAQGKVKINGTEFMLIYWAGNGSSSKGFLIASFC